jgi:hypothetical protein
MIKYVGVRFSPYGRTYAYKVPSELSDRRVGDLYGKTAIVENVLENQQYQPYITGLIVDVNPYIDGSFEVKDIVGIVEDDNYKKQKNKEILKQKLEEYTCGVWKTLDYATRIDMIAELHMDADELAAFGKAVMALNKLEK